MFRIRITKHMAIPRGALEALVAKEIPFGVNGDPDETGEWISVSDIYYGPAIQALHAAGYSTEYGEGPYDEELAEKG